ncbi:Poly(U)-specific endoribonuclease-C [Porphyridium purpureum]|uniref:Poly(U)-specific endoribonuclease-C n=1 Tax=Porphyridium purpureum TaxID=35688 RepID=A0A5J4YKZ8_PORPP|nr:Poly(U)-specific endoribonuclease-C [Porphyridium purpureum]|eukprot:POR7717..scf244_11
MLHCIGMVHFMQSTRALGGKRRSVGRHKGGGAVCGEAGAVAMASELRVALQKRHAFIKSMQMQNKVPTEEQLSSFLAAVVSEASAISADHPDLAEQVDVAAALPQDLAFDLCDDALEDLISKARAAEIADAMENVKPTDEELGSVSLAVAKLWELDVNRLAPGLDYVLDLQTGKKFYDQDVDTAEHPLFKYFSSAVFRTRPTYSLFYHLLDNYESATGVEENATDEEKKETWTFINTICTTPVMKYVFQYLSATDLIGEEEGKNDMEAFKRWLYRTWFYFYRRDGANDSSAFEHAFLGELRDDKVIGMHNWMQIMVEEKRGNLNYTGYIKPRRRGTELPDEDEHVLGIQFEWKGCLKPMSSMFVGVSPEFEIALYTLVFLAQDENIDDGKVRAIIEEGSTEIMVVVHKNGRHKPRIGSAFPELVE